MSVATFVYAVIVGLIVYIVSMIVPFLASYAGLLGLLAFLLVLVGGAYPSLRR